MYLLLIATGIDVTSLPHASAGSSQIQTVINIVLGILGALALLVIVISGFRYILSAGDPQNISKAKDGILYAIIGLVVVIFAEVIVSFVVGKV